MEGKNHLFFLIVAGFLLLGSRPADSQNTPTVNRVIYEMEQVREAIDDLVAVVQRESHDPVTGEKTSIDIELKYKKPDRLRTEVKTEGGRQVIINGMKMWIYSPDIEIVEEYRFRDEDQLNQAIYEMSWGLTSPIKALVRGMNREVEEDEGRFLLVKLTPDRPDSGFRMIKAWVDPDTWLIERMVIEREEGTRIVLEVKKWLVNSELDDGIFDFKPPEGVEVFEALQGQPGGIY